MSNQVESQPPERASDEEEKVIQVIKLDEKLPKSERGSQIGSLPISRRESELSTASTVEISQTIIPNAQANNIRGKATEFDHSPNIEKIESKIILTRKNSLVEAEKKKSVIKRRIAKHEKKSNVEHRNLIQNLALSTTVQQKLGESHNSDENSYDNIICNALNNLHICHWNSLFHHKTKVQTVTICFCEKSYSRGSDGLTYHTICSCCMNK